MDALELQAFEVEVLKCDHIWNWIDGTIPRYTFQYVEYRFTRSRLHQMYIMHHSDFLPNVLDTTIYHGQVLSNHFPLEFVSSHQLVAQFHDI